MKNCFHPVPSPPAKFGWGASALFLVGLLLASLPVTATEVWTGSLTGFAVVPGTDWTQATNQDRLTPNVWLARSNTRGLFNAATESGYASYFSPANTAWAYGSLSDYAVLNYSSWETWNGHNPPTMVGQDAVLHLLADDVYLSINFTSWGGPGGGFAYVRSTPAVTPEPGVAALSVVGLTLLAGRRRILKTVALDRGRRYAQPISKIDSARAGF